MKAVSLPLHHDCKTQFSRWLKRPQKLAEDMFQVARYATLQLIDAMVIRDDLRRANQRGKDSELHGVVNMEKHVKRVVVVVHKGELARQHRARDVDTQRDNNYNTNLREMPSRRWPC